MEEGGKGVVQWVREREAIGVVEGCGKEGRRVSWGRETMEMIPRCERGTRESCG